MKNLRKKNALTDSEKLPYSSAYRQKYYLLKRNVFSAHIQKNTHYLILSNQIFGIYLEQRKELQNH